MRGKIVTRKRVGDDGEWDYVDLYFLDGREVTEAEYRAAFPSKKELFDTRLQKRKGRGWPLHSTALACHPDEREAAEADAKKKGVPTSFDAEGRPIFTGRDHRKRFCMAYAYFDKDAGYGDAQKGSFKG